MNSVDHPHGGGEGRTKGDLLFCRNSVNCSVRIYNGKTVVRSLKDQQFGEFAFAISIYLTIPNLTEKPAFELEAADLLTVRELAMDVKYYLNTSIGGDGLKLRHSW
ncbi:hypothetical protein GQ457_08G028470 [Hibiscus cannabinus]